MASNHLLYCYSAITPNLFKDYRHSPIGSWDGNRTRVTKLMRLVWKPTSSHVYKIPSHSRPTALFHTPKPCPLGRNKIGTICPRTCQFRCTTFVYTDPRAVNPTPWLILYLVGSRCRIRTHSPGYQKPLRYQLRQSAIKLVPVEGNDPTRAFRH